MSHLQNFKYDLAGSEQGPKLVFLHGALGSGANWRKIVPAFQRDFRILTFDQRGHGRSFKPPTGYAPEDYAQDLKLILDELGWSKVVLIGHSMGGRNALQFAHDHPERVEALVIEDIGPQGNPAAMEKTIRLVEMVPTPFASKAAAKDYFTKEFVQKRGDTEQSRILGQYFYTNIVEGPDGSANWRFSKEAILSTLREGHVQPRWAFVRELNIPTLFIRGEHSEDFPREEFTKVLSENERIKGVEVAEAGHWVHFDQPETFIRVLREFLRESLGF